MPNPVGRYGESGFERLPLVLPKGQSLSHILELFSYDHDERTSRSKFTTHQSPWASWSMSLLIPQIDNTLYVGSDASLATHLLQGVPSVPILALNHENIQEEPRGTVPW